MVYPRDSRLALTIENAVDDCTPEMREKFLAVLRTGLSPTAAARAAGAQLWVFRFHQKVDELFAEQWLDAIEEGTDNLEDAAWERAVHGEEHPIYQGGQLVGTKTTRSDKLMELLLKARRPEKYREMANIEYLIRDAAVRAGVDPDEAVAEAKRVIATSYRGMKAIK